MSRYFMIQSWVGSHENEPDYNGQQCGERNVRSSEVVPLYDQYGNANVAAFSDEAIAARSGNGKKITKVPLKARILPQSARVDKLRSEAIELELAFKAGEFTPEEYTLLREVAFKKLRRAEELLKKAITPIQKEEETDEDGVEYTPSSGFSPQPNDGHASEEYVDCGVEFIDSLSNGNSFKKILQRGCKGVRILVRWHQAARNYINELKAL